MVYNSFAVSGFIKTVQSSSWSLWIISRPEIGSWCEKVSPREQSLGEDRLSVHWCMQKSVPWDRTTMSGRAAA